MHKVFYRVGAADDFKEGTGKIVQVGSRTGCSVFRDIYGNYYAAGALCPHLNEPLDHGRLEGCEVICRAHHLRFSLKDGKCTNAGGYSLQVFDVRIVDNFVEIGIWEDNPKVKLIPAKLADTD